MAEANQNRFRRFLIALCIGGVVGAFVGTGIKQWGAGVLFLSPSPGESTSEEPGEEEQSVAWQYATAYQAGDWERVLERTLWAQERLELVAASDGEAAAAQERDRLMADFGTRNLADNYLRDTGVEDQYIFTHGAKITYETVDEGRDDLERPVANRTWFRVTFPTRDKALLDKDSIPIRSLRAGVNVSHDGYVLKANIVGNLDIDWASIAYDWPSP